MHFVFTEQQRLSQRTLRELLDKDCTAAELRAAWSNASGRIAGLWEKLVAFGVVGLTAPPSFGGLGLDEIDLVLLLEESGRAALPEPILETTAVAIPLLSALNDHPYCKLMLRRVAGGTALVLVALQSRPFVPGAQLADALLIQHGDEAHLVPSREVRLVAERSVDHARHLHRVAFVPSEQTRVMAGDAARELFEEAFDRGAWAAAALLVGLGARLVEMAIAHAKTREQFGRPIGSFQAVQHQLVDAHLGIAFARPLVYRAAHSLARRDPDRSLHVSMAKAFASEAAWRCARSALQVHGAIGYSYEHDLHLWMKRVWALAAEWGDAAWHRARVAEAILGEA